MAHPTRRFFCIDQDNKYKMYMCFWQKYPRPADLDGSHPCYEDDQQVKIRFLDLTDEDLYFIRRDHPKIILEMWTAPDCIFDKKDLGSWMTCGHRILYDVVYIKDERDLIPEYNTIEITYRFGKMIHTGDVEKIQLSVEHIPDDQAKWFNHRPRLTAEDILNHRNYNVKPDVIIG